MNSIRSMLLIILFTSWTSCALAERRSDEHLAGSVSFYGTIVDGGCSIQLQQESHLQTLCRQNGQRVGLQLAAALSLLLPLRQGTTRF